MPVYLELFHGRKAMDEQLDDWGSQGPILGPLRYVHTTYATDIKLETIDGVDGVLELHGEEVVDLLYYDGVFYGDWSVFAAEVLERESTLKTRVQQFEPERARATEPISTEALSAPAAVASFERKRPTSPRKRGRHE
jgi:hypothetical protein